MHTLVFLDGTFLPVAATTAKVLCVIQIQVNNYHNAVCRGKHYYFAYAYMYGKQYYSCICMYGPKI